MKQEDKKLLLKDLCSRLPYHPIVKIYNDSWEGCQFGEFDNNLSYHHVEAFVCDRIEIEPYLRPMSSMTKEERNHLQLLHNIISDENYKNGYSPTAWKTISEFNDYCCAHHLDNRGFIRRGLVIEASENMYNN